MKYTKAGVFQFSNTDIECIRNCITFLEGRREGEGLKGSLSRDFQLQVFSQISFTLSPECPIGVISNILQKFTEIFTIFVFIAGVNDTGYKLFTGVNDAGDLLLLIITGVADTNEPCSKFLLIPFVKKT
jgi:hypothetical protein